MLRNLRRNRASPTRLMLALACVALSTSLFPAEPKKTASSGGGGGGGGTSPVGPVMEFMPELTSADWPPNPSPNRVMVILNTAITDAILAELSTYGVVHGWVDHYRMVAMTPTGDNRAVIAALPFVRSVETDQPRYLADIGTCDRDIIDVVDVEESGTVGDPDRREVNETGAGVHVAVIDTGLPMNWRDFFDASRVDTTLARAFVGGEVSTTVPPLNELDTPTSLWEQDTCGHGTAVASHVIGFKAFPFTVRGVNFNLGPFVVDGAAPGSMIIPLRAFQPLDGVCSAFESRIVAAIDYVIRLVENGTIGRTVINMSFGGPVPVPLEEQVINDAIAAGIIVVAAAGNRSEAGMTWPGAFPEVISAGAVGWTKQFRPGTLAAPNPSFWFNQDVGFDPDPRHGPAEESEAYVAPFSGRAIPNLVPGFPQELDVLAPGSITVAPCPFPEFQFVAFCYFDGTSFSSPQTAGVAALMLEKNPTLTQAQVEAMLKSTARPMKPVDSRPDVLRFLQGVEGPIFWDDDCSGMPCDPVGAGLLQADGALAATPRR